ncbi:MAG: MBL fold metallo-hydrolase [Clostridia bacterium]|nr:MBL fold metallo-hydrolase [Clostridia bacterium]
MKKKIFAILCASLALMMLFSACNNTTDDPEDSVTDTSTPDDTSGETEPVVEVEPTKVSDYVMITPKNMTDWETDMANSLYSKVESKTGVKLEYEAENYTSETDERYEIVVGITGRAETTEALSKLSFNEYGIFVSDYKIVITGWTDYTARLAVLEFNNQIADFLTAGEDGVYYFDFDGNNEFKYVYTDYYGELPPFEGTVSGVYDCGDDCYSVWYGDAADTAFASYSATVAGAGYTLTNENKIGSNSYATYIKDDRLIHIYYVSSEKSLRVVYGPNDVNPELMQTEAEQASAKKVTPSATLMPMKYISAEGGGACMVFLLEDGTFFVIDGGWKEEADVLYNTLKALNEDANGPDAPIVISSWFMSHGHGDHYGCLYAFAPKYGKEVIVNSFICNGVHDVQTSSTRVATDTYLQKNKLKSGALNYFKTSDGEIPQVMKIHTGQKLTFGGAEIDVLFTHEDVFDKKITNFNDFNTILRLKLGGNTFILANDACKKELPAMIEEIDDEELQAEFCMVTHHGADSGYTEFYRVVGAKWYFWPNSKAHFIRDTETLALEWAVYVVNNNEELYLADTYCNTLVLPYEAASVIKWNPDNEKPSDYHSDYSVSITPSYGETAKWTDGVEPSANA